MCLVCTEQKEISFGIDTQSQCKHCTKSNQQGHGNVKRCGLLSQDTTDHHREQEELRKQPQTQQIGKSIFNASPITIHVSVCNYPIVEMSSDLYSLITKLHHFGTVSLWLCFVSRCEYYHKDLSEDLYFTCFCFSHERYS